MNIIMKGARAISAAGHLKPRYATGLDHFTTTPVVYIACVMNVDSQFLA